MTESERRVIEAAKKYDASIGGNSQLATQSAGADLHNALAALEADNPEARELLCEVCHTEHPIWWTANPIWNAVMRNDDGPDDYQFVCPTCFIKLADQRGVGYGGWFVADRDWQGGIAPGGRLKHDTPPADDVAGFTEEQITDALEELDCPAPGGEGPRCPITFNATFMPEGETWNPQADGGYWSITYGDCRGGLDAPDLGTRELAEAVATVADRIADTAYSHGFTAGQQHRSDGGEVAVLAKIKSDLEDFQIGQIDSEEFIGGLSEVLDRPAEFARLAAPASSGEGEPPEQRGPYAAGDCLLVADPDSGELENWRLNPHFAAVANAAAQPPSADLVAAARKGLSAIRGVFQAFDNMSDQNRRREIGFHLPLTGLRSARSDLAAALENTPQPDCPVCGASNPSVCAYHTNERPEGCINTDEVIEARIASLHLAQPDESEAVKLRDLAHLAKRALDFAEEGWERAGFKAKGVCRYELRHANLAREIAANTPEVDNAE